MKKNCIREKKKNQKRQKNKIKNIWVWLKANLIALGQPGKLDSAPVRSDVYLVAKPDPIFLGQKTKKKKTPQQHSFTKNSIFIALQCHPLCNELMFIINA